MSKYIAVPIDYGLRAVNAPAPLAVYSFRHVSCLPESVSTIRAAPANQLQRSVNLLLGSVLASISLTIPAMLVLGYWTHETVILGVDPVNSILLVLTLGGKHTDIVLRTQERVSWSGAGAPICGPQHIIV